MDLYLLKYAEVISIDGK